MARKPAPKKRQPKPKPTGEPEIKVPVEQGIEPIPVVPAPAASNPAQFPGQAYGLFLKMKEAKGGRKSDLEILYDFNKPLLLQVLQYISLGAFDHVASESLGIHYNTFVSWMRKGQADFKEAKETIYCWWFIEVMNAKAKARHLVEMELRTEDKKFWLKHVAKTKREVDPELGMIERDGWTEVTEHKTQIGSDLEGSPIGIEGGSAPADHDLIAAWDELAKLGLVDPMKPGALPVADPTRSEEEASKREASDAAKAAERLMRPSDDTLPPKHPDVL